MRIVAGCMTFLILAAGPASAGEAFVTQLAGKGRAAETTVASYTNAVSASMLASPLQLGALKPYAQNAPATPANVSSVTQDGMNNLAVVSQTAGSNLSSIVQHGVGNQAIVTQRH
jgi:hypothetical protein